ncbi:bola domain protein [Teratosphaeria destructans]|uniref:Bola domain protein n=1 Tax=Teratosphaeria destructans TaxID=418781 RepID=A0A9W7SQR2_9PEZI|nr:bola domain protein [Teratosphaeria destructans]
MLVRLARASIRRASTMATSSTPMEDAMRKKINDTLAPTSLEIFNDSHKHAHHQAMQGSTSKETHFRYSIFTVYITSEAFQSKMQAARHRMVYTLLKDEMASEGGIHALQLRTRTPEEEERARTKESTV